MANEIITNAGDPFRKEKLTVKQMSGLCDISVKTIKWWAEMGLIFRERDSVNGYYYYNYQSLQDIMVIKELRLIGVPLKDIGKLLQATAYDIKKEHNKRIAKIDAQIEELLGYKNRILQKNKYIDEIENTDCGKMTFCDPPFDKIAKINLHDPELLRFLNYDPNNFLSFCVLPDPNHNVYMCVALPASDTQHTPIWTKSPNKKYMRFLSLSNHLTNTTTASANVKALRALGYNCTGCIFKFLLEFKREEQMLSAFDSYIEVDPLRLI